MKKKLIIEKSKSVTPVSDEIVVHEKHNRGVLFEGRSTGMGFAMLKKISDSEFHTVNPASPCKDYLNEVIFTENFGFPTAGCGLKYPTVNGIFDEDTVYVGMRFMPNKNGSYGYSKSIDEDIKRVETNKDNILKFLHFFEEALGISKSELIFAKDKWFVLKGDKAWAKSTHGISLYTLLFRISPYYNGDKTPEEFLASSDIPKVEEYLCRGVVPKIKLILAAKKLPPQRVPNTPYKPPTGVYSPHNAGILGWDSVFDEVDIKKMLT